LVTKKIITLEKKSPKPPTKSKEEPKNNKDTSKSIKNPKT